MRCFVDEEEVIDVDGVTKQIRVLDALAAVWAKDNGYNVKNAVAQ